MAKKIVLFLMVISALLLARGRAAEQSSATVSITGGVVKQPLHLTMDDLAKLQTATIGLNEVTRDGTYHGVFPSAAFRFESSWKKQE